MADRHCPGPAYATDSTQATAAISRTNPAPAPAAQGDIEAVGNPALAQLLVWRPVPGFAPTEATFAASRDQMEQVRAEFAEAARLGQLRPEAGSAEALHLYTVVLSGLISQQMANEPGAAYERGRFSSLADAALDMFFARYAASGGPRADPRP